MCTISPDLESIATILIADGKGIRATDETVSPSTKRFNALGIPSTEQSRAPRGRVTTQVTIAGQEMKTGPTPELTLAPLIALVSGSTIGGGGFQPALRAED